MDINDLLKDLDSRVFGSADDDKDKEGDILALQKAWVSELTCPEILPYQDELLEQLRDRLDLQIEEIERQTAAESGTVTSDVKFSLLVIESEVERVRFLIRSYLRTRIAKLSRMDMHYARNTYNLSQEEIKFIRKRVELLSHLYDRQFNMRSWPENLKGLEDDTGGLSMVTVPDMNSPVIFKVVRPIEETVQLGDETIELMQDSIYAMRYSAVQKFIANGAVVML
ncbi:hypothetical protein CANCADRAFT_28760 [Tortispora caseinolytica NRRL Y-17796]|uniref:DNA replication complex GINS protein SLD5 n=1 Tax=Tortispora caseinolytica NRRL Y-17796 TaxID=767744 RepID=A0A1E4TBP3_9ASCO|nr:hypothetical protein CANCADRAFT_28760 [Tortispora caseinolytica NRRL Y-17796]